MQKSSYSESNIYRKCITFSKAAVQTRPALRSTDNRTGDLVSVCCCETKVGENTIKNEMGEQQPPEKAEVVDSRKAAI